MRRRSLMRVVDTHSDYISNVAKDGKKAGIGCLLFAFWVVLMRMVAYDVYLCVFKNNTAGHES
ncbi:MAG TPA: hypothetical protein VHF65_09950 [Nitrososphaera sp.]|nr:hypothetical protein [Nitrososphaera sp.]